jgi:hydroxymethylbilane synthase
LQSAGIRIGTRGSPLALTQAEEVRRALAAAAGDTPLSVVPITTSGDRIRDRPLAEAGGKGLFTKEIDEALLSGRIDVAVHSAKDIPGELPPGIAVAACLKRADVRDAFISSLAGSLADLPAGTTVGTSSPRRMALALRARPDLIVVNLRGNVETRLRKIDAGEVGASFMAVAGLVRLGLFDRARSIVDPETWLPPVGQGTIAIAARADDRRMRDLLERIGDRDTRIELTAERAYLARLGGSCRTPIGGLARVDGDRMTFRGIIIKPDGSAAEEVERAGAASAAERLGADAGDELVARGGRGFFGEP